MFSVWCIGRLRYLVLPFIMFSVLIVEVIRIKTLDERLIFNQTKSISNNKTILDTHVTLELDDKDSRLEETGDGNEDRTQAKPFIKIIKHGDSLFYKDHMIKLKDLPRPFTQELPSKQYTNLLDVKPPKFLPNFKNPCWVEEIPKPSHIYGNLTLWNGQHAVKSMRQKMEKFYIYKLRRHIQWRLRCLPYFYIAGVQKCGTSELFKKLALHPNITKGPYKEPHFWTRFRAGWTPHGFVPIRNFIDLFDEAAEQIRKAVIASDSATGPEGFHPIIFGEGSVTTMNTNDWWFKLPENAGYSKAKYHVGDYIKHITPNAKFILTLRNPTDRLYSDYTHLYTSTHKSPQEFHEVVVWGLRLMTKCLEERTALECVSDFDLRKEIKLNLRQGLYVVYLKEWLKVFPMSQLHIVTLENLKMDKIKVLNGICNFLDVGEYPLHAVEEVESQNVVNSHGKYAPMMRRTKLLLDVFHAPFNKELAEFLQDDQYLWK